MTLLHKKGDKGQEVRRVQKTIGGLTVDGDFGPKTEQAVKDYQKSESLSADGVVGPATRGNLGIDIYAGIDVSHWNGNVPWGRVNKNDVHYAWVKTSQGRDWNDKAREHNFEGCRSNGILVGGYHFPSPHIGKDSRDPKLEAQHFIKSLGTIEKGDMLPVLDLEAGVKGDPDFNRHWALEFLKEFENETGIRCAVYTARWYVSSYLKLHIGDLKNYPLWVADYTKPYADGGRNEPDSTCGWGEYSAWQWTGSGYVRGLGQTGVRKCDRNWLPGGPDALDKMRVK